MQRLALARPRPGARPPRRHGDGAAALNPGHGGCGVSQINVAPAQQSITGDRGGGGDVTTVETPPAGAKTVGEGAGAPPPTARVAGASAAGAAQSAARSAWQGRADTQSPPAIGSRRRRRRDEAKRVTSRLVSSPRGEDAEKLLYTRRRHSGTPFAHGNRKTQMHVLM